MPLTGIRTETPFSVLSPPKLIRRLPPLFVGISMPFLTGPWIGGVPTFWIIPGKAVLPFLPFFVIVVWSKFRDLFILLHLLSLGLGQMAHCHPGLTLSGVPIHGYISCGLVTCWLALIPTIVLFFSLFLFRNRLLAALAAGSSTPQSSRMLVSDLQSRISGLGGKI